MADDWGDTVPIEEEEKGKEQEEYQNEILLFGKWSYGDLDVADNTLTDYISFGTNRSKTFLPHTAGRWQAKRFRKANCPIIERLVNSLMMHGRNTGKKLMAVRIVKHTLEIIHLCLLYTSPSPRDS